MDLQFTPDFLFWFIECGMKLSLAVSAVKKDSLTQYNVPLLQLTHSVLSIRTYQESNKRTFQLLHHKGSKKFSTTSNKIVSWSWVTVPRLSFLQEVKSLNLLHMSHTATMIWTISMSHGKQVSFLSNKVLVDYEEWRRPCVSWQKE